MTAPDPFALGGRQDGDAELYRLIAEYRSIEDAGNSMTDDDESDRLFCDLLPPIRDRISAIRPATLAGILAALEFFDECGDPDCSPEEAIKGLRVLIEGGAR